MCTGLCGLCDVMASPARIRLGPSLLLVWACGEGALNPSWNPIWPHFRKGHGPQPSRDVCEPLRPLAGACTSSYDVTRVPTPVGYWLCTRNYAFECSVAVQLNL